MIKVSGMQILEIKSPFLSADNISARSKLARDAVDRTILIEKESVVLRKAKLNISRFSFRIRLRLKKHPQVLNSFPLLPSATKELWGILSPR